MMNPEVMGIIGLALLFIGGLIGYRIGTGRIKLHFKKDWEKLQNMVGDDIDKLKELVDGWLNK